jgi:hypothetical protein
MSALGDRAEPPRERPAARARDDERDDVGDERDRGLRAGCQRRDDHSEQRPPKDRGSGREHRPPPTRSTIAIVIGWVLQNR